MTDRGYGPRSCEITKEGRRALSDALEADETRSVGGGDGTSPEAVEELREEIDELEDDLSSIQGGFSDVFNTGKSFRTGWRKWMKETWALLTMSLLNVSDLSCGDS